MNIPFFDKFPADVIILQKMGDGFMAYRDKARYKRQNLLEVYELKKRKKKFRPPNYNYMIPTAKGRPLIILYEYSRDMYVPVETNNLSIEYETDADGKMVYEDEEIDGVKIPKMKVFGLKAADEDMSQWASVFRRQAEDKYKKKSFLEKYQVFIMMVLTFVFLIVLTWIFMQSITDTGKGIIGAFASMAGQAPPPG